MINLQEGRAWPPLADLDCSRPKEKCHGAGYSRSKLGEFWNHSGPNIHIWQRRARVERKGRVTGLLGEFAWHFHHVVLAVYAPKGSANICSPSPGLAWPEMRRGQPVRTSCGGIIVCSLGCAKSANILEGIETYMVFKEQALSIKDGSGDGTNYGVSLSISNERHQHTLGRWV
jgi:hypothetical protein